MELENWISQLDVLSDDDIVLISSVLERVPRGVLGGIGRDARGCPRVIANHPLVDGVPMPTLFWLIDPELASNVADLERRGGVKRAEEWIAECPERLAAYQEEHQLYAQMRVQIVTDQQWQDLDAGRAKVLRESGIGGIAEYHAVKCLHLQAAWALALRGIYSRQSVLLSWLETNLQMTL